ncbi:branched-chain amino acid ABC transporter permease [Desulfosporosinus sp.]|uniref:branched-chain amino acid ABC transporter permease n=1 Tax=Desulfosporosinus sp. TaxID=157907 RepID=UPI0025BC86E7|nr:branched-chain amino acid ABC transporter permease [Desulfosporosinus sp.]MBC2721555.1 branched-chain amino acid ABC transporter permease [Desulfosporosinus sp.]MBC2727033.1 branched-chain amino acid ABC transporter permease [Desulfosporosinus sp.]
MSLLLSQVINAIMLGSTYSLIAIGFSLFFGVMDIVVFSAGDVAIVAAFSILVLMGTQMLPVLDSILPHAVSSVVIVFVGAMITALLMLLMYRLVIKPFEGKSPLMPLLSTIASGIVLRELIGIFYPQGRNPQAFPQMLPSGTISSSLMISWRNVIIILATVFLVALLYWFVNKTKIGLSIQAVSQNREAAMMVGLNWRLSILVTFLIGGFLLGVSGFLVASYSEVVRFDMGSMYGLKGFSAAVVGGLGSMFGGIAGGMLIAFIEVFVTAYIPGGSAYSGVAGFLMVIVFILFKPEGILGEKTVEKV